MTERILSQVQSAEMRFNCGSSRCDTSRQSAQRWNSESLEYRATFPNRESPATLVRPCVSGEASPAGYIHVESGPEVVQGAGGETVFPTLLGPAAVWGRQNLRLLLIVRYFKPSFAAPAPLTRGKTLWKWMTSAVPESILINAADQPFAANEWRSQAWIKSARICGAQQWPGNGVITGSYFHQEKHLERIRQGAARKKFKRICHQRQITTVYV